MSSVKFCSCEPKSLAQVAIGDVVSAFSASPDLLPELASLPSSSTEESFGATIVDADVFGTSLRMQLAATEQPVVERGCSGFSATGSVPASPIVALMQELSPAGEYLPVVEPGGQYWQTYNFEIEEYHTYIADGIQVHNRSILSYLPDGSTILDVNLDGVAGLQEMTYRTADGAIVIATGTAFDSGSDTIQIHRNIRYNQHGLQFEQDAFYDRVTGELVSAPIVSVQDDREFIGGNIGRAFGSQIGAMLGGDNAFQQIAFSTVLGTITQNFGEFLRTSIAVGRVDASVTTLGSLIDILQDSTLADFGTDFTINLTGQVSGYFSSMLMAEVSEALGLEGFSAGIFTTTGTTISQQLTANLTNVSLWENGFQYDDLMQGFNENIFASAFSSYIGGTLAREVVDIDSPIEGLFAGLGSTIAQTWLSISSLGSSIAGSSLGTSITGAVSAAFGVATTTVSTFLTSLLLPGIGAFLGTIGGSVIFETLDRWTGGFLSGLWGQWTGEGRVNYRTDLAFDDATGRFVHTGGFESNGDEQIREMANAMREAFSETVNAILEDIGGLATQVAGGSSVFFGYLHGEHDVGYNDFWTSFDSLDGGTTIRFHSLDTRALVNAAIYQNLQMLSLLDGDLLEVRVLEGWQATVEGLETGADPTSLLWLHDLPEEVAPGLAEYMRRSQVADDYRRYLEDRTTIDALIANDPNSAFAAGWVATLIAAAELGLDQPFDVVGTDGDNLFLGGEGADVLDGAGGNDTLQGYQGEDTLIGGAGNDQLIGGGDNDHLDGGLGDDTYVFRRGDGYDTVVDAGGNDRLTFEDIGSLSSLVFARDGSDLLVARAGSVDLVRVENWYEADGRIEILRVGGVDYDLSIAGSGQAALFPVLQYIASHDDLREELGTDIAAGLQHYVEEGLAEGRDVSFSGLAYIASHADLIATLGTDGEAGALHYLDTGYAAGRTITFDPEIYLRNYSDLRTSLGGDLLAATRHFIETGHAQGRSGTALLSGAMDETAWTVFLQSTSGDSTITGTAGADWLAGTAADDVISGGEGNDILLGGGGRDTLLGGNGNDILDAGGWDAETEGWQVLAGGAGDDTYVIGDDIGRGLIDQAGELSNGGTDTVRFVDLSISDLEITLLEHQSDLGQVIRFAWGSSPVRSAGEFHIAHGGQHIERFVFSDGSSLSGIEFDITGAVTLVGTAGGDLIVGTAGRDTLVGGAGDDILDAGGWTIDAPNVWQRLSGGAGNDTYIVGSDVGLGIIDHTGEVANGGMDTVRFEDLTVRDLQISLVDHQNAIGEALRFFWTATEDRAYGEFHIANGAQHIERFVFADGSTVSSIQFDSSGDLILVGTGGNDTIIGGDDRDTLIGGAGNDVLDAGGWTVDAPNVWQRLSGGAGDDTYIVGHDIGRGIIDHTGEVTDGGADTVRFENLTLNDLQISLIDHQNAIGEALRFVWNANANRAYGEFHIANGAQHIERFVFADGTSLSDIQFDGSGNLILIGTAGNDTIVGTDRRDTLIGGDGDDVLDAGGWTVDAPNVWQHLSGGAGNDTYIVGDDIGRGLIDHTGEIANGGADTVRFENLALNDLQISLINHSNDIGEALRFAWSATDDRVAGQFHIANGAQHIERFVFADGTTVSGFQFDAEGNLTIIGTDGNDTIIGTDGADNIIGGAGNDTLDGGAGADVLTGGLGNDRYIVDNAGDLVVELAGEGVDTVESSITFQLWAHNHHIENLTLTGGGHTTAIGNMVANVITGNSGNNWIDGAQGADTMIGGAGDDTYVVDNIGDTVQELEGEGFDVVRSSVSFALNAHSQYIENLILIGTGNINGTGNGLANVITGNSGNNVLNGGNGNDTLIGGAGNDTFNDWHGADRMEGGTGDDTYHVDNIGDVIIELAGEGIDTVISTIGFALWDHGQHIENLTLAGTAHINGTGNGLANVITGNAGNNVLNGGQGADTLRGGLGDDRYIVDNAGDLVVEAAGEGVDTVESSVTFRLHAHSHHIENLTLTGSANIGAVGNMISNVISGNSGNNWIDGAQGADTMIGGAGDDTYYVDNVGDVVVELAGEGFDVVHSSVNFELWQHSQHIENLILTGTDNINGVGNSLANVITGNSGDNVLNGGQGADTLIGGAGDDTYDVDNVGDVVVELAGDGVDVVRSSVSFELWQHSQHIENLILTGNGNINGVGNSLANVITGNSGNNVLNGGQGADTLIGGAGNDTYDVDNVGDTVQEFAGEGFDIVRSSVTFALNAHSQYIENLILTGTGNINGTGNGLANVITGNSGNNILNGGNGDDILIGGAGDDTFNDWHGNDTFTGGSGADTFCFLSVGDTDTITDFEIGIDTIQIGLGVGNFSQVSVSDDGADTILTFGTNTVRLQNVDHTLITENDFAFV